MNQPAQGSRGGTGSDVAARRSVPGGDVAGRWSVPMDPMADLETSMKWCDIFAQSDVVPKALRGHPANILVVWAMGHDIGLSLTQAVREIYCPPGGVPQMKGRLLLARLEDAGHEYDYKFGTDDEGDFCEFTIWKGGVRDEAHKVTERFSVANALDARLVQRKTDGTIVALSSEGKAMPWMLYQKSLLFWRAVALGVNRGTPKVALGFDIMEAGPAVQHDEVQLTPQPPGGPEPAGPVPADPSTAGTGTAPAAGPTAMAPGPSPETVAELAELDRRGSPAAEQGSAAGSPGGEGGQPASREEQRELAAAFERFGWAPRKHKPTILNACTAWCGRPILRSEDLTAGEVAGMIADMATINGPDEASPVLLADRVEVWKQKLRERDRALFETLFPEG